MYFGEKTKRTATRQALQHEKDLDTGKLLQMETPDVLIGLVRVMGTGLTLTNATVVIIMDPLYNSTLLLQVLERAHRLGQKKKVHCYIPDSDTDIENLMEHKRVSRAAEIEMHFKEVLPLIILTALKLTLLKEHRPTFFVLDSSHRKTAKQLIDGRYDFVIVSYGYLRAQFQRLQAYEKFHRDVYELGPAYNQIKCVAHSSKCYM